MTFADFNWYAYVIIPLLIFLARIIDVSIGTIRVVFISKGYKHWATVLGFFEVLVWLAAIGQIMQNLTNVFCYFGYAAGFSTGTYVGIVIEEKLSMGKVILRVVTRKDAKKLLKELREMRQTGTCVGADGPKGKVRVIITVLRRQDLPKILKMIKEYDQQAFYSVEDVRYAKEDVVLSKKILPRLFTYFRKGK